ncbi:MAG TPA: L-lactate permease [bacterium]|nr:L-lactate permease [bacterium]
MPVDAWRAGIAGLPILVLLAALLRWRWSGARAGAAALVVAAALGGFIFGLPLRGLALALGRAVLLSLHVLYIIWGALVLYAVAEQTGAIRSIGDAVARLTEDHILQLLIIGFAFSAFLQGVAGFGVPVAVTAPLLLGLGFRPLEAAAVPLVGHAWAVTMGDMASSFQALRAVTGLPARPLGIAIAALLGLAAVACGFAVAHIHAGRRALRRTSGAILALGLAMGGTQLLLAITEHWIVASFGAGMVGLAVSMGLAHLARRRPGYLGLLPEWPPPAGRREPPRPAPEGSPAMSFHLAFLPYYTLIAVVALATFIGPVHRALGRVELTVHFPAVATALRWRTGEAEVSLALLGHPGALLAYTTAIAALLFRLIRGRVLRWRELWPPVRAQGIPTTATILALVGVAMVMAYSGMTITLARALAALVGPLYPLAAPLVGLLGTVITGSNTNSNVLFGPLQRDAAQLLGMDPILMAALQSAGGALGSMVAPAKVVLATATTGLAGREGEVMRLTGRYAIVLTAGLSLVGFLWSRR